MDKWRERQRVELTRCLESFDEQFHEWEARTEKPPWETHYSQVRAATAHLGALRDKLRETLLEGQDNQIELRVLSAWRVWDAFRSRLAQRQEEMFRLGLSAADEIAWACRVPVATAFGALGKSSPKEPALSFLNGAVSPSALVRDRPFAAEPVYGEMLSKASERLLEHLPVPLIGLPWHEVFHAPGMLSISHEAGHVVEADFQLTAALDEAMEAAAPANAADWKRWRAEIFADQFALRHCGPAYAAMMADLLAPRLQTTPANSYPPHAVRMELCFVTLEVQGLNTEAGELRDRWRQRGAVDPIPSEATFIKQVPSVVQNLGDVLIGAGTFADLIQFKKPQMDRVLNVVADINSGNSTVSDASPQCIAAAAWMVFEENPAFFENRDATEEICARIVKSPGAGSRRGRARRAAPPPGLGRRHPQVDEFASHADAGKQFAEIWLSEPL